jgi:twitching motility protein PilJ
MAGEAGRGFAVVADEVQRLAERSANATRQIEALVKTIQADTNEAVISMEKSTAGVVKGAQLAENASSSLEEIESISEQLAGLIQNISNSSRSQAEAASDLTATIQGIQQVTNQATSGTEQTSRSIGNLSRLAQDLDTSVAGFKLPQ